MTAVPQERRVVTAIPGPKSQELQARRNATVAAGVGSVLPVFTTRAGGGIIEDVDGNRLIDFGSGIAVTSVGASAEAVVRRASAQLAEFTHSCFMVTPYEGYVEVCEQLAELTPGDHPKKSALFNSGAEAVENAVKIARAYTKRQAVVVFDHGYHGRTNLTMALTSKNMPYKNGFGPFAPEVYRVPVAYGYRWPSGPENAGAEASAQAIDMINKQIGADNVAAIIIEPVLGEGGFIEPAKGFLPAVARFAKDNGIVFVADEIQSGFCRTGQWFACEDEGIVPDLITTAKGIAGGLPLSAVTGRAEIMDAAHSGGLGGTYGGNPVACRRRPRLDRDDEGAGPQREGPAHRGDHEGAADGHPGEVRHRRRHPGPRRDDRGRAGQVGQQGPQPGGDRSSGQGLSLGGTARSDLWHLRQRAALPAPAGHRRGPAQRGS